MNIFLYSTNINNELYIFIRRGENMNTDKKELGVELAYASLDEIPEGKKSQRKFIELLILLC